MGGCGAQWVSETLKLQCSSSSQMNNSCVSADMGYSAAISHKSLQQDEMVEAAGVWFFFSLQAMPTAKPQLSLPYSSFSLIGISQTLYLLVFKSL